MTAQLREVLEYEGQSLGMASCPPLPQDHPRIEEAAQAARRREDPILGSTACWRGYQGSWRISGGRLHLVALRGRYRLRGEEPLLADWFSGVLRVPRGAVLQYVHMGFATVHEEELHLRVERGVVTGTRVVDNRGRDLDRFALGLEHLPGSEPRVPGDDDGW